MQTGNNSVIHSWQTHSKNVSLPQLEVILNNFQSCPVIYHTRHKACYLIPEEISGLPYKVVFKHYRERRFFRYLFRPSQAYREFLGFAGVQSAGIPTAEVLALGERRSMLKLTEAFFVTRYLENYRDGNEFVSGGDPDLRDEFIRQNLSLLAKLHRAGFVHGGFHPRNELFRINDDGKMEVIWIDLATVRKAAASRKFTQENDLDRFMCEFEFSGEQENSWREFYRTCRDS